MKTIVLNVAWLIIVSIIPLKVYNQIVIDPNNSVELNISCDELDNIIAPLVSSSCEGEINSSYEDKLYSGGCYGTIERIWTISDICNNVITYQQFIHLSDNSAPILSEYPENITVNSSQIPPAINISASDNCDPNLLVEFSETPFYDDSATLISIQRKWTVKDKCGNQTSHEQVITISKIQP